MEISLQLYSIKSETEKDFKKAIHKVGKMGFRGVEFAGYGGLSAYEVSALLKENQLYSVGTHCGIETFEEAFENELAFNKAIGSRYIICPYAKVDTMDEIDRLVRLLNEAGDKATRENIKVGYHNHAHEFIKINGKYPLDIIAESTNDNVILELDVFWIAYAGVDPIEYIKKCGRKAELIHIKQMDANRTNVDIEDGVLDMQKIKNASAFAEYFILEHEEFDKPVWDSIQNDFDSLVKIR